MNFLSRSVAVLLGGGLLCSGALHAQDAPAPAAPAAPTVPVPASFGKEFSADILVTNANGLNLQQHIFGSGDKIRSEGMGGAMPMSVIIRPDQQKIYSIMDAEKMVTVMPFDPHKMAAEMSFATGLNGKYETIGAGIVDGIACTEYKYTSTENKVFDLWVDNARKIPLKMAAQDQSFTMLVKNYQAGPQDPALFEIPEGYQVVTMPGLPSMEDTGATPTPPPGQP
jgi:hypothetical protein